MTSTLTSALPVLDPALPVLDPALLVALRPVVGTAGSVDAVVERVATVVTQGLPGLAEFAARCREDAPAELCSRIVHAESGFSLVALTLPPGASTSIHDHLTWCVVAVLTGTEHETTYHGRGDHLVVADRSTNLTGSVTTLTPPGDIHRVRNDGATTAVSLHVYGADLRAAGSSVRRTYDLPVRSTSVA